MYCNQCGNIITEGSSFCSFCGAKSTPAEQAETQVSAAQPTEGSYIAPNPSTPAAATEQVPVQPVQATPAPEATVYQAPEQQDIPRMAPNFGGTVPIVKEKKPKEEKYYTFGHLMLCLSAVALMAIVAGVFAGLYFSVR